LPQVRQDVSNQSDLNKMLDVNRRIYIYMFERIVSNFLNQKDFESYFDLFEFFIGLLNMNYYLDKGWSPWGPIGKNYRIYSGSGRNYVVNDTVVHRFIENVRNRKNDVLKIGFFDGKVEKFENVLKEYQSFLGKIR